MIPVLKEIEDEEERQGEKISEFKEEILMNKKTLKKSMRRAESIDNYMKEIGNELTKQDLYRDIHKLVSPLLPTFQLFEKRGELKNNVVDYSVTRILIRSLTTSSWPIPSCTTSPKASQIRYRG
jgi:hypothetical protein